METKQQLAVKRYIAKATWDEWAGLAEMSDGNAWSFDRGRVVSNYGPVRDMVRRIRLGHYRYELVGPDWSPRS